MHNTYFSLLQFPFFNWFILLVDIIGIKSAPGDHKCNFKKVGAILCQCNTKRTLVLAVYHLFAYIDLSSYTRLSLEKLKYFPCILQSAMYLIEQKGMTFDHDFFYSFFFFFFPLIVFKSHAFLLDQCSFRYRVYQMHLWII